MKVKRIVASVVIAAVAAGSAFAGETVWKPPQEIAPRSEPQAQADPAPVVQPAAPAKTAAPTTPDARRARAKECSAQADAKGLHGKERKKFRDECKKS